MSLLPRCSIGAARAAVRRNALRLPAVTQVRNLNLHEYQSKDLMAQNGIPTQRFRTVEKASDAKKMALDLNAREYVVKAQIHAGGRGKGSFDSGLQGGVKLTRDPAEVEKLCSQMLGYKLKTNQTPPEGVPVHKVMIAEALDISKETYLALLMDRATNGPVIVASPEGGMDIEEVAHSKPGSIHKVPIDINKGVQQEQVDRLAKLLGFEGPQATEAASVMKKLYDLFVKIDATQIEINPFGLATDGRIICFDAKLNFDDNAAFRQEEIFAQRDPTEEDPREIEASKYGLSFVGMDGNIGCMVNGAGLAMATMDIIKLHGGSPANFLDLGGGVSEKAVSAAFDILTKDKQANAILVNIFGGIVDCALVARGIISAAKSLSLTIPVTVRLRGNNEAAAKKLISESRLKLTMIEDMDEAAAHAVSSTSH